MDTDTYLLIGVLCVIIVLPIVFILGSILYGCLCNRTRTNQLVNELVTELVNETNYIENNKNTLEGYEEIDIKN
jgi:small-conductance mechanosensitive channel